MAKNSDYDRWPTAQLREGRSYPAQQRGALPRSGHANFEETGPARRFCHQVQDQLPIKFDCRPEAEVEGDPIEARRERKHLQFWPDTRDVLEFCSSQQHQDSVAKACITHDWCFGVGNFTNNEKSGSLMNGPRPLKELRLKNTKL